MAYNLETILSEKLETVLSRNIANTRPRDFYDIHILYALRASEYDLAILKQALAATTQKRGSTSVLSQYREIVANVRSNPQMLGFWEKYRKDFHYAKDVSFGDACDTILRIMDKLPEV
jgi:hypothetical protein